MPAPVALSQIFPAYNIGNNSTGTNNTGSDSETTGEGSNGEIEGVLTGSNQT